jgi:hypothetical protein
MAGQPATIFPLRVTSLWAFGEVLDTQDDLDWVRVVLAVDLPVDDVAWWCPPAGAEHWSNATRLSKNPVAAMWRSTRAPLWNHHIHRPLLIWDESGTPDESARILTALREGEAEPIRLPEPTADAMAARLEAELAVSLQALEAATATYDQRRFSPGKLQPLADALWQATAGYLNVLTTTNLGTVSPTRPQT